MDESLHSMPVPVPVPVPRPSPPPQPLPNLTTGSPFITGPIVSPPNALAPMIRSVSSSQRERSIANAGATDWRAQIAIEERITVRKKLRDAYKRNAATYDKLLDIVTAIDEELVFATVQNRLDYFKTAIEWDNRLKIKRQQLGESVSSSSSSSTSLTSAQLTSPSSEGSRSSLKRRGTLDEDDIREESSFLSPSPSVSGPLPSGSAFTSTVAKKAKLSVSQAVAAAASAAKEAKDLANSSQESG